MSKCSSVWLTPKSVLLQLLPWKHPIGVAVDDQHCILGRKLQNFLMFRKNKCSVYYVKSIKQGLIPWVLLLLHSVIYYTEVALSAIGIISWLVVIIMHLMFACAARHL